MQTKVNRQLYFDMQEHPERYTDEQVEAMMDEMDREPDTEQAWQEWMERMKNEELRMKNENHETNNNFSFESEATILYSSFKRSAHSSFRHRRWLQIAAIMIGVVLISGIAIAAIYMNRHWTVNDEQWMVVDGQQAENNDSSVLFDNVPLDSVLGVVAAHYQKVVRFRDEAPRSMKLIMTWNPDAPLADFLDRLNAFDGLNLRLENDTVFVTNEEEDKP